MHRLLIATVLLPGLACSVQADVIVAKTPDRGIQPQAIVDANGDLHLLYFSGDPRAGNLKYVRCGAGRSEFSTPIQVNSQDGSAIAVGTIRGGHLALGKNSRVHVAWNGSMKAEPKKPIAGTPMLYSRLNEMGTGFEPQRNLMTRSAVLDGGGSLAADSAGNVFVAWHALDEKLKKGENNRKVWVSASTDDGKTFAAEKLAWDENTGACGCCGMRGFADSKGDVFFFYRAASEKINRGMYLLKYVSPSQKFAGLQLDNWKIDSCPMSSEAFAEGPAGVFGAWETRGQIYFRGHFLDKANSKVLAMQAPGNGGDRKHPALAFNKNGDMILVWAEGTGWMRGGTLAWQVYDRNFEPIASGRRAGAIPVWGLPAAVADGKGDFVIFH